VQTGEKVQEQQSTCVLKADATRFSFYPRITWDHEWNRQQQLINSQVLK